MMDMRWRSELLLLSLWIAVSPANLSTAGVRPIDTPFGTTTPLPGAFHGKVYYLPIGTQKLPDFELLHSVADLYTYTLQVAPQKYLREYPGTIDRIVWFGIEYFGAFWIKDAGVFHFFLRSDDGAKLYIDDVLVIDNDGIHQAREIKAKMVEMPQGLHRIRVSYYQGEWDSVALQLAIQPPGERTQILDTRNFTPPGGEKVPALKPRAK